MRVLMSIHHPLDVNSGAPGVTWRLANALRLRGHTVDIVSFERVSAADRFKGYIYPWFIAGFVAKHPHYDVLDLSSGDGWVLSVLPKAWLGNPKPLIVARSHGLEHVAHQARLEANRSGVLQLSWKYPVYHGGFRLWECGMSFSHANAALFLSSVDQQYAVAHLGVDPSRAIRVRNGIADCFVERARSLLIRKPPFNPPQNIAFIGRYTEMKGRRYLRLAMRALLSKHPKSNLGLFGTMVDRSAVLADFPSELRNRIFVVPTYDNEHLPTLLAGYHVLAFPSLSEGFPAAPLEAMACGLVPVVAATPGPMSYIKSGRNGVVVALHDANALESEITRLIDDPNRWNAMRRDALATAIEHSWDDVASETERIYVQFIAGNVSDSKSPAFGMDPRAWSR